MAMGRFERRTGILAAALLAAGVLLALAGERFAAKMLGDEFARRIDARGDHLAETRWREGPPVALGSHELQGVAVDAGGLVAVIAGTELLRLGPEGAVARRAPLPGPAFCLAFGGERVFVGLRDRVAVLDRGGGLLATWEGLGERAWLTSIAVRGGDVLVADAGQRLVWRFDTTGRLRSQFGRRDPKAGEEGFVVPSPYFDLAFGPAGELWVVNPGAHRVQRRSLEGRLLAEWGETSLGPEGFSGCCNPSHITLLPDGSFATSEKGVPRVTLFDSGGRFLEVVAGPASFAPLALDLDLAVDARGRILVLDPLRGQLRVFERATGAGAEGRGGA
jgi:hypothetical protein